MFLQELEELGAKVAKLANTGVAVLDETKGALEFVQRLGVNLEQRHNASMAAKNEEHMAIMAELATMQEQLAKVVNTLEGSANG